jgi:hypothetical protein
MNIFRRAVIAGMACIALLSTGCASNMSPEERARLNESLRGLSDSMRESADYTDRNRPRTIYCNSQSAGGAVHTYCR